MISVIFKIHLLPLKNDKKCILVETVSCEVLQMRTINPFRSPHIIGYLFNWNSLEITGNITRRSKLYTQIVFCYILGPNDWPNILCWFYCLCLCFMRLKLLFTCLSWIIKILCIKHFLRTKNKPNYSYSKLERWNSNK